jgi:hypothetical protein
MADQDGDDAELQSDGMAFIFDEADLFPDDFDCCPDDPGLSARSSHTRKEITEKSRMRRDGYGVVMEFALRWLCDGLLQKDALVMEIGRYHAKNGRL